MSMVLAACVTINIYFPAAAAEEAAREIVRDVLQSAPSEPSGENPPADDKRSARPVPLALVWSMQLLERLVPDAQAAQADINISTPAIAALRKKMEARQAALAPFYRSGAIGFDREGMVGIRDLNAVALPQRNQLKKLVADENADRKALYREIARANGHPEWEAEVRATFARVWVQEAPRGYWFQDAGGRWQQR
ncbi:MAG: YdbL family protein [Gammaproteobacteria bacterium]